MHITLRAGERLFLNGAVLRADRKVSIELMNDATFLLEAHVMHADKATTPMRQLYFVVQMMLMNPLDTSAAKSMFVESHKAMKGVYEDAAIHAALDLCAQHVANERYFDGLKVLRQQFDRDDALLHAPKSADADLALAS